MSAGGDEDSSDKEHDPSQKRLDDARARGEIARSADLATACGYGGLLLATIGLGTQSLQTLGSVGTVLLDQADSFAPLMTRGGAAPFAGMMTSLAGAVLPFFALPALAVLAYLVASKTLIFTPDKLAPKLSRISPVATAKQKFGRSGLFEFGKSFVKLLVISTLLTLFLVQNADDVIGTLYLSPALSTALLMHMLIQFMTLVLVIALVTGGIDFFGSAPSISARTGCRAKT